MGGLGNQFDYGLLGGLCAGALVMMLPPLYAKVKGGMGTARSAVAAVVVYAFVRWSWNSKKIAFTRVEDSEIGLRTRWPSTKLPGMLTSVFRCSPWRGSCSTSSIS